MDTKVTFGKTNKRQGYHIIISFALGEATEEQALDIVACFAQGYLKDKYEAVYAVHNDKKHMHGHIVFNSVSFETGMKHECKKGNGSTVCSRLQTDSVKRTDCPLCQQSM